MCPSEKLEGNRLQKVRRNQQSLLQFQVKGVIHSLHPRKTKLSKEFNQFGFSLKVLAVSNTYLAR